MSASQLGASEGGPVLGAGGQATPSAVAGTSFAPALTRHRTVRRYLSSRWGVAGAVAFGLLLVTAIVGPFLTPFDPVAQVAVRFQAPNAVNLLGTDELGRDIFSRLVHGTSDALFNAIGVSVVASLIGVPMGLLAGYASGWIDALVMRVVDLLLAIPSVIAALVILSVLGPGSMNLLLAIAVGSVPQFARLARAGTLSVRQQDYVAAARTMGASDLDIVLRTILPNIASPLLVQLVVTASAAVVVASALNFLGFGAPPPAPTWGGMLQSSRTFLGQAPWYGIFPGLAITFMVFAFDGIGRGLQAAFGSVSASRGRVGVVA